MDNIKELVIPLIVISSIITGVLAYNGSVILNYGDPGSLDTGPFRQIATLANQTENNVVGTMKTSVEQTTGTSLLDTLWVSGSAVIGGLTSIMSAIPIFTQIMAVIFGLGFIPAWVTGMIVAVVIASLVLIFIVIILRWKDGVMK